MVTYDMDHHHLSRLLEFSTGSLAATSARLGTDAGQIKTPLTHLITELKVFERYGESESEDGRIILAVRLIRYALACHVAARQVCSSLNSEELVDFKILAGHMETLLSEVKLAHSNVSKLQKVFEVFETHQESWRRKRLSRLNVRSQLEMLIHWCRHPGLLQFVRIVANLTAHPPHCAPLMHETIQAIEFFAMLSSHADVSDYLQSRIASERKLTHEQWKYYRGIWQDFKSFKSSSPIASLQYEVKVVNPGSDAAVERLLLERGAIESEDGTRKKGLRSGIELPLVMHAEMRDVSHSSRPKHHPDHTEEIHMLLGRLRFRTPALATVSDSAPAQTGHQQHQFIPWNMYHGRTKDHFEELEALLLGPLAESSDADTSSPEYTLDLAREFYVDSDSRKVIMGWFRNYNDMYSRLILGVQKELERGSSHEHNKHTNLTTSRLHKLQDQRNALKELLSDHINEHEDQINNARLLWSAPGLASIVKSRLSHLKQLTEELRETLEPAFKTKARQTSERLEEDEQQKAFDEIQRRGDTLAQDLQQQRRKGRKSPEELGAMRKELDKLRAELSEDTSRYRLLRRHREKRNRKAEEKWVRHESSARVADSAFRATAHLDKLVKMSDADAFLRSEFDKSLELLPPYRRELRNKEWKHLLMLRKSHQNAHFMVEIYEGLPEPYGVEENRLDVTDLVDVVAPGRQLLRAARPGGVNKKTAHDLVRSASSAHSMQEHSVKSQAQLSLSSFPPPSRTPFTFARSVMKHVRHSYSTVGSRPSTHGNPIMPSSPSKHIKTSTVSWRDPIRQTGSTASRSSQ